MESAEVLSHPAISQENGNSASSQASFYEPPSVRAKRDVPRKTYVCLPRGGSWEDIVLHLQFARRLGARQLKVTNGKTLTLFIYFTTLIRNSHFIYLFHHIYWSPPLLFQQAGLFRRCYFGVFLVRWLDYSGATTISRDYGDVSPYSFTQRSIFITWQRSNEREQLPLSWMC